MTDTTRRIATLVLVFTMAISVLSPVVMGAPATADGTMSSFDWFQSQTGPDDSRLSYASSTEPHNETINETDDTVDDTEDTVNDTLPDVTVNDTKGDHHGTGGTPANVGEIVDTIREEGANALDDKFATSSNSGHTISDPDYNKPSNVSVCPDGAPVRNFSVHAVEVDIVLNKYGQHMPDGRMYVLEQNKDEVLNASGKIPSDENESTDLIQPLTIRAHQGDCVKVEFTNDLNERASMHMVGLPYNVSQSDGMAVGYNPASFAEPGETVNYTYYTNEKGSHFFGDGTDLATNSGPDDNTLRAEGLFGSLVVEDKGTKWIDPDRERSDTDQDTDETLDIIGADSPDEDAEPVLRSGQKAIIKDPNGPDHREFIIYYHDGMTVRNADGSLPTWPHSDVKQDIYAMNYRADPLGARLREDCTDCGKPEGFYSSYLHGDPGGGDLVFPTYVGDPVKFRLVGAQVEENHVHHLHGHRWKSTPGDASSNTIDAQSISPGSTYNATLNAGFGRTSARANMTYAEAVEKGGAGYAQKSPGDYIFHCHLFPHYASGMWSVMRVNDKEQADLRPLPDREEPPNPTEEDPGYPNFINATEGKLPPKPPDPTLRQPTALEESAINGSGISDPIVPGAPYSNPCPDNASMRYYNITVFQTNITYNNYGDYDDKAQMYALTKNVEAIKNGSMKPEPLVIRANQGDCVQVQLTNYLPKHEEPNEVSIHIHYVGFDVLGSDGVTLGYNYDEGAEPGEKINYRWYADEQGTIFWHDHLSGVENGMHGTQGAIIVEPKDAKWLDPYSNKTIDSGTDARIIRSNGEDFREQVLFYQDYVRLHDAKNGKPLNGPHTNTMSDQGVRGINYANAPLYRRNDSGPSLAYSSWMHGDPQTPMIEAYKKDPVKIRLIQGTFEEQHNFVLHGKKWRTEYYDGDSVYRASQTIGTSEKFQFNFQPVVNSELPVRDYLYGSMTVSDQWNGMWGLFRVWQAPMKHLEPLPDQGYPTDEEERDLPEYMQEDSDGPVRLEDDSDDREDDDDDSDHTVDEVPKPQRAGNPCPDDAPERRYDLVAFQHNISYNDYGDHDPHGIVFATEEQYEKIQAGKIDDVDPLVLRANKGECIEVRLENELPEDPDALNNSHPHAKVPPTFEWENSNRISLHPQGVVTDVLSSDGATIGANYEQTVAPGDKIKYHWYAGQELGTTMLTDMADIRSHRHHGAFGQLIIEPADSTWLDPETGEPIQTGTEAIIQQPNGEDFREFALMFTDGMYIVNNDGTCPVPKAHAEHGKDDAPCNQALGDPEEQGFKGINYDSEPFARRFAQNDSQAYVFSSKVHGEPNTPIMKAYEDDPVVFRVGQAADRSPGMSLHLTGHQFHYAWQDKESPVGGVRGELSPGVGVDLQPRFNAGGRLEQSGDYLLMEMKLINYLEGGLWSIFRVVDEPRKDMHALPDRQPAAPRNVEIDDTDNEGELELVWDAPNNKGDYTYSVYRSTNESSGYVRVNDDPIQQTKWPDEGLPSDKTYYYYVVSVSENGVPSEQSEIVKDKAE